MTALKGMVSPLPRRLLGTTKVPLRAFVGKLDPSFDWALRERSTNQSLTHDLVRALCIHFHGLAGP